MFYFTLRALARPKATEHCVRQVDLNHLFCCNLKKKKVRKKTFKLISWVIMPVNHGVACLRDDLTHPVFGTYKVSLEVLQRGDMFGAIVHL
jgi:hypothetical protein